MFRSVQDALTVIYDPATADEYRLACEYLVTNRGQLTQRVFIVLPGGLDGNSDPIWDAVKVGSHERCSCGNERVIVPLNPRADYVASSADLLVVTGDSAVYLKPIGGNKPSTLVRLQIEQAALTFMTDPYAPLVLTPDLFSTRGYTLEKLADVLPKQSTPPVFIHKSGGVSTPVFAIVAVDQEAETVTIQLDAAVEAFDPDILTDHECS